MTTHRDAPSAGVGAVPAGAGESPSVPDPVNDAAAYQRTLLAALGQDDPAVAQGETPERIRELLEAGGDDLGTRPAPLEWSALLCLAHIVDAEVVMTARYRWVLAHDAPELIGYDQDLWADRLHQDDDPSSLVSLFEPLRQANITLWTRSSPEDRARVAFHRERGPESYDLMFRMLGGHDRVHLAQAYRALDAVRGEATR